MSDRSAKMRHRIDKYGLVNLLKELNGLAIPKEIEDASEKIIQFMENEYREGEYYYFWGPLPKNPDERKEALKEKMKSIRAMRIQSLGMSEHAVNMFHRNGYITVDDFLSTERKIFTTGGLGTRSIKELTDKLEELGYKDDEY